MKKGLMKGAVALVLGGFLVGCSHDDDFSASMVESKVKAYEQVFVETFGRIDPTHDWGFAAGDNAAAGVRTRATGEFADHVGAYPDANMWTSKGFLAPDPLEHAQQLRAQYYFQMNRIVNPNRPDNGTLDFFIQQVYDGGDDPMTGKSPEVYKAANGTSDITSGEHMDHLTAGSDHLHIYNFNNGNCSVNPNVADRTQTDVNDTNQQHADKIQLMLNTPTNCFGYANSDASCVRDDRWTLVSAQTIDDFCDNASGFTAWLNDRLLAGETDVKCVDQFNRSYIGFDFDMIPDETIFTGEAIYEEKENPSYPGEREYKGKSYSEYDYYRYDLYGAKYHYLSANTNQYCGEKQTIDPAPDQERALGLLADGWLPVGSSADKDWVKVGGCADGYYSDWIVTFMPASQGAGSPDPTDITIPLDDPTEGTDMVYMEVTCEKGRVFCEDLGNISRNDLDFNDVVFDAYVFRKDYYDAATGGNLLSSSYETYIVLLAAGGTLPISVAQVDVHDAFGGTPTGTIINTTTDAEGSHNNSWVQVNPVLLDGDAAVDGIQPFTQYTAIADIPINVRYSVELLQLQSDAGAAPHKICVQNEYPAWCRERVLISSAYTKFTDYVGDKSVIWWNEVSGGNVVTDNLYPNIQPGDDNYPSIPLQVTNGQRVLVSGSESTGGYSGTEVLGRRR